MSTSTIPKREMIDIHMHLIPGVDDGAEDMEMATVMLLRAKNQGMDNSIRNWARKLVLEKKADFLGTDAHRTCHRPPSAERGLNWLYENVERGYAEAIAWGNAQKCLCV